MRWLEQKLWSEFGMALAAVCGLLSCDPPSAEEPKTASPNEPPRATAQAPRSISLASWNMQWLTRNNGQRPLERDDADYQRLRHYAERLDADVVALQEVDGAEAARRVFDDSVYDFHFSSRRDVQRTGFAFRRTLDIRAHADFETLSLNGTLRRGTDISLELDGQRLRLLSVHLKAGCLDEPLDTPKPACVKLSAQLPLLEQWIDDRASSGVAFAVLGDFNRRLTPRDAFYVELDDADPPGIDLELSTQGQTSSCWGGRYPQFIDHILLSQNAATWLVTDSFRQLLFDLADDDQQPPDYKLSDHCPIAILLKPARP